MLIIFVRLRAGPELNVFLCFMKSPKTDLKRVWADAAPLYEYLSQRAQQDLQKPTASGAAADSSEASEDATARAIRGMALALEYSSLRSAAFDKAQRAILN